MKMLTAIAFTLFLCGRAFAGGSLPGEDLEKILQQDARLWSYLRSTLDFSDTAWGVRCGNHWPLMGGTRIAPYTITVTPKGTKNETFTLVVECEQHFFDKSGKELPLENGEITDEIIRLAARVEEKPLYVKLISSTKQ